MNDPNPTTKPRHIPIRADWLALGTEAVVDPRQPIIDAHHHLWEKPTQLFGLPEMEAEMADGHDIVATVFSEGRMHYRTGGDPVLASLGETEFVTRIAQASEAKSGRPCVAAGISGFVDLTLGARAGEILDRHVEISGGRFRGVRNTTAWHADADARGSVILPPPGLAYDPAFRAGLKELAQRDLVFDAWAYHTQLGELVDLAHANPDLVVVINHFGGPIGIGPYAGRRTEIFADWRQFIGRLAACPNVSMKLGGFGMLMAGFDFHERPRPPTSDELADAWRPYVEACVEAFGASRCMFESNFPVDKGTASYRTIWNAFKKITHRYSADERHDLFFGTAVRIYRLRLDRGAGDRTGGAG